jgi:hypothetical protein
MDQATNPSTTSCPRFHNHGGATILLKPTFIDQIVTIDQSASLIDYVNRFKNADTLIFADADELEVHAVIDYHAAGSTKRGLAEHHAVLSLSHSAEWEQWNAMSGRMYEQKAFARMLDLNSGDIRQPKAATIDGTELPPFFLLSIPVFTGEPKVDVRAMTLDNLDRFTGKVSLGLELVRTRAIVETELTRIAHAIADATSVPVILGSVKY